MDTWLQVAAVIGMFILRLGVPLAITLGVSYWLRRLDARWQAEALARRADTVLAQQEAGGEPVIEMLAVIEQPCCWEKKECPAGAFMVCPAYQRPELPCWLARLRAEGRLPRPCYGCELFTARQIRYRQPVN
ncbi:MAG: hypothetical protein AB1801_10220 [Chloroflexota bacterium]